MKYYLALILFVFSAHSAIAAVAKSGSYKIDKAHTNISFSVSHMGISFVVGRFNRYDGVFNFVPNGQSTVSFELDVASIDTNSARRDKHLKSSDFFDANRFPKMKFVSSAVTYSEAGDPKTITGLLTLHGSTNEVELAVSPVGALVDDFDETRAGFKASAVLLRSEYGMTKFLVAAGDEVQIHINIEGIKQ